MFNKSLFESGTSKEIEIPENTGIIFVSDLFSSDYPGGAELTTDSLIETSPYNVFKVHSHNVTSDLISKGASKYWIFGNFSRLNNELIPSIVSSLKYSIIEYDYKYCIFRSPEKHEKAELKPCDCSQRMNGKIVSAFMYGSDSIWWMSENQMKHYHELFPFLAEKENNVLSSIFNLEFFDKIDTLRKKHPASKKSGHAILGSTSWVKGTQESQAWCEENSFEYKVLSGLSYDEMLKSLAESDTFVCLPPGGDTCPRVVIEAKLLGCKLILNENVQHKDEEWFNTDDLDSIQMYLLNSHERFWSNMESKLNYKPTISGYTQAYNCVSSAYPWRESIKSLLGFCDEVVVLDGGSNDGTWEDLLGWSETEPRLVVKQLKRDWDHKRFALFNGQQKAAARCYCTSEWLWQVDIDEIVHEEDYQKIKSLVSTLPKNVDLVALPIIEYWGGKEKVRVDINPWKWRLSRNKPHITHGLPGHQRLFDEEGQMYSAGSDGDDYIRSDSFQNIPCATFYTEDMEILRQKSVNGDSEAIEKFASLYSLIVDKLPSVYHYSWFDMGRKVRTYRDFWSKHWASLYNKGIEDTQENNMFFNKPWSEVSEEEIDDISKRLSSEMGGWIFHSRVDFSKPTPSISLDRDHPSVMENWIEKHEKEK